MLGCSCQLSSSIAQHFRTHSPPPRQRTAQLDGRAGEARPEGEKCRSGRRKACFHPGGSSFSLPRGMHAANFSALQFHPISFHAANRFFVSFLTQERNVLLVSFSPPSPSPKQRPPPRLEEGVALLLSIHAYPQSTRGGLRRVPPHVHSAVQHPRAQIDRAAAIAHNAAVLRVHADV